MSAIGIHRIGHWLHRHRIPVAPWLTQLAILLLFNTYLPSRTRIGRGSRLGHRGIAVVINGDAVIGANVLIRAHVTIGKLDPDGGAPVIEDDVEIGDGAKVLGAITIGTGARIGANAVVLTDVPAGATAVGVPARIRTST